MHFGFIKDVSSKHGRIFAGLDIGSTGVRVVVGEIYAGRKNGSSAAPDAKEANASSGAIVQIIGAGYAPSRGIKKGVVINIEQAVDAIREAVEKAEELTGIDIKTATVGITGSHIGYITSEGIIAVKEKEIGQKDVEMVLEAARAVATPFDREILHVIPTEFIVNGQDGITDPRGMAGVRLEAKVQIITGSAASIQNVLKSCEKAGLEVADIVFQPIASAEAVLKQDEKELGVALIDIGGGTTDIAVFQEGHLSHFSILAVGGSNFTNDVAIGLRLPFQEAEQAKREFGCTMLSMATPREEMEMKYSDARQSRKIPRTHLIEILQPRAEELFGLIRDEITSKGLHKLLNSGVVLAGGAVLMEGMDVMAENILDLPVRTGIPAGVDGERDIIGNPGYAAGIGLVCREANAHIAEHGLNGGGFIHGIKSKIGGLFGGVFKN
ncbi:MAG: cell division protein FtsA [Nitrospiraceae bacterium]|nr:MAG: cell division protein FtsA [Nitrospiraceae bacterium]